MYSEFLASCWVSLQDIAKRCIESQVGPKFCKVCTERNMLGVAWGLHSIANFYKFLQILWTNVAECRSAFGASVGPGCYFNCFLSLSITSSEACVSGRLGR